MRSSQSRSSYRHQTACNDLLESLELPPKPDQVAAPMSIGWALRPQPHVDLRHPENLLAVQNRAPAEATPAFTLAQPS